MNQNLPDHISVGRMGEDAACAYLVENAYKVLERNYRKTYGEIDIVAQNKDKTLVFVEVKTLSGNPDGLAPEDNLTGSKLIKLKKICENFANKNPELVNERKGWQIDLVAITLEGGNKPEIRHYENIG